MLIGLALIAAELRYLLMLDRFGVGGRILLFAVGGWLSVWGLKEVIAGLWPSLGGLHSRRRHRFKMPLEGYVYVVIMIVLFVGSLLGQSNPLMLVFSLLAGPFIVNGGITFRMLRGLSVERTVPGRVMAGEPFSVEIGLRNPKRWASAWLMGVRDRVDNGREYLNPEILFARVGGRSRETGRYQLRLTERGRYSFGPIQVNSRFPLGLVERGLVLAATGEVLVYPRIGRLAAGWQRRMQSATQLATDAQIRVGSFNDDFHRIREYRSGDEPRSIHWRTTARRSELMVREFRESRDRDLIVLLDAWQPENATPEAVARVEYAISFAATVLFTQMQRGRGGDLFLAAAGAGFREWGGSVDPVDRDRLLDLLALLQASSKANLDALVQSARREQSPQSRTLLITPTAQRAAQVDWDVAVPESRQNGARGPTWSEPPQTLVADPAVLGDVFSLER
jgi:uncharacterized protein (DUF58 family)